MLTIRITNSVHVPLVSAENVAVCRQEPDELYLRWRLFVYSHRPLAFRKFDMPAVPRELFLYSKDLYEGFSLPAPLPIVFTQYLLKCALELIARMLVREGDFDAVRCIFGGTAIPITFQVRTDNLRSTSSYTNSSARCR